ncbi:MULTISPECIES: type 1 glutamine amidotransferase [unclassified Prochlorococcus]|uniref:type 1 glutamine amidotransferase n=1 Tax=unclassified Prochlorococcus TaxID=2627481 RepID=UPI0005339A4D|nr:MULTISPECIES: type 1 glutamine amidotransferase [unclassified Prochlorococcus]KGG16186.1 Glutamine amidotransferase class-I [Prochlorococcus sp. MIT 0603]KGG18079.1 Glutamine amidotransferase class-I [Prochlorococcus sp. MIT 0602]
MKRLIVIQHVDRESAGLYAELALKLNLEVITCRMDLNATIPEIFEEDILLVMGGPMGVKDINTSKYHWLSKVVNLLRLALKNNFRVIGVCLGAQLLAYAGGGDIEAIRRGPINNKKPEVGWGSIYFNNKNHPLNIFSNNSLDVLHWHGDRILLPPRAELIASSLACKEQLFSINDFAYGIQFHVEVTEVMFAKWVSKDETFVKSALGENAIKILKTQQELFYEKTLNSRIKFINKLYNLLI